MKRWFAFFALVLLVFSMVPVNAEATTLPIPVHITRQDGVLLGMEGELIGNAEYWNTGSFLRIDVSFLDGWLIKEAQVYQGVEPPPLVDNAPVPGLFPCVIELGSNSSTALLECPLEEMGFKWGQDRTRFLALHGDLIKKVVVDGKLKTLKSDFWGLPGKVNDLGAVELGSYTPWPTRNWGGFFQFKFTHPSKGHFIDSPVGGVWYQTDTHWGTTDSSGGFDYFPGEMVDLWVGNLYLGRAIADQKISPLDLYDGSTLADPRVINMARFLQSLDADGDPKASIEITPAVTTCLDTAAASLGIGEVDFSVDADVDALIDQTIANCSGVPEVTLLKVAPDVAVTNLNRSVNANMFRKNISDTPAETSSKSKLDIMSVWLPARKADGTPVTIEYDDDAGNLIRTANTAKPIIVTFTDAIPETGAEDIFAAVSRDDGQTFKRMNLSRSADESSFTLENGTVYWGDAKKPVGQVKGNNILIAWTSKFCRSGSPSYAISTSDEYLFDDPYYKEDIWGVGGPQRSVDYAELEHPEVGEIPFSCVWTARGTIVTQTMLAKGGFWANYAEGDIVWFKSERLTSGRRDANQVIVGASDNAGFAVAWQEDPEGLLPGDATGPGDGWSGATVNHKTDIWYSFITMNDFAMVDENFVPGSEDAVHYNDDSDWLGRPKALVPMSLPVRLTDNEVVNTENMMVQLDPLTGLPVEDENGNWIPIANDNPDEDANGEGAGTHAYAYRVPGLCDSFYTYVNKQDVTKHVCVTADGRLLDGDTGSSRPNLNLQTYKKPDGTYSAYAMLAYEESKGMGGGEPEENHIEDGIAPDGRPYKPDEGKNVIYHTFDFLNPTPVSAGTIINLPETDADGNPVYLVDELGNQILDWAGNPQLAYENARRPRFIMQGYSGMGGSRTIMAILYKEGQEGQGRPSDIMMRRVVVPKTVVVNGVSVPFTPAKFNPYNPAYIVPGMQNLSTVEPTVTTESTGDPLSDDPWGAVKVVQWRQGAETVHNRSSANPWEDARAHRGDFSGDFLVIGYTYTPNWGASRNGNDKYDFFVRRSFDGGQTWTTDPAGAGVTNCDTFTDPLTKEKTEICNTYGPGQFEQARNVSQMPNNKMTVIEPRIVGTPANPVYNSDGTLSTAPEDMNNSKVFYLSYGTATNPDIHDGLTVDDDDDLGISEPMDLFYSFTLNKGESYELTAWNVNPDSLGNYAGETVYRWASLAYGDMHQGEAQLRMTADGSRFYATWLEEGNGSSDIMFRRIMSPAFPANNVVQ